MQSDRFKWDTSALKIVDNLVIGLSKKVPGERIAPGEAPRAPRV